MKLPLLFGDGSHQSSNQPSDLTETADKSMAAIHKNATEIEENPTVRSPSLCIVMEAGH